MKIENGVVKFYFASGKADVAAGGSDALAEVIQGVAAGQKVLISGFHDASGDPMMNADLAKERAFAVRDLLTAGGVAPDMIELRKPEQTEADGSSAEARRVEVTLL